MARWLNGSRRLARRLLPLSMGCVVVIFVASTAYTELLLADDVDALDISSNSAPSIAALADARGELRPLAAAAARVVTPAGTAAAVASRAAYEAHRRRIEDALAGYAKTPDYAGEAELYRVVRAALARVDATVRDGAAEPQIDAAVDEADNTMRALSDLNRGHLEASVSALAKKARRRNLYAFIFDAIGIMAAFIATVLAARTVERYLATLRRRERELEHLAIEVGHEIASPLVPIELALGSGDGSGRVTAGSSETNGPLARARRGVGRIRASLERLTTFAAASRPPDEPPRTPLLPALAAAAQAAGLTATADPELLVSCAPASLQALLSDLVAGGSAITVAASSGEVRVTVARDGSDDGVDPFDPQLHVPGTEHPGLDLRLATVRRRVEACGGHVGTRRFGRRRQLWIELPRA